MKIITDEQYEVYQEELTNFSGEYYGFYHNWIDNDHEQSFSRGDATDEQIKNDALDMSIQDNDGNIDELNDKICLHLTEILNRRIEEKIRKIEEEIGEQIKKCNERKYCVANYKGELAGHDLSETHAILLCAEKQEEEPEMEWEVIPN
jgi:hypothetical protein